ncbi:vanadium-dependent haloperoxidase [Streptomyces sp. NPDC014006]|uniref:vanadium-dependent haloperoxidase n=1 Tax=Streptomyces sp. NPDC014006 TaxID=3364870 RepID=UPI00370195BE
MASPAYQDQVAEVRLLGAANSTARTTDQTAAAWFWANDADGTYKPPGQMLDLTRILANQWNLNVYDTARAFALVSLAMADGAIAEWDVKYQTPVDLWRPVWAIQVGLGDTTWQPLGPAPCFPALGVRPRGLRRGVADGDDRRLQHRPDLAHRHHRRPQVARAQPPLNRFSDAAEEDALSRLYLCVPYRWDAVDGLRLGRNIGSYVVGHELRRL